MDAIKKLVKEDINFLEYPNWILSKKKMTKTWSIQKEHGKYEILSPLGLPKHFDKIVIYSLLYKLYREKNLDSYVTLTNRYEIAKSIFGGNHFGKNIYTRIMGALRKWASVTIHFEGLFFEGDGYTEKVFHILDGVTLRKDSGELTIRFNEDYISQLKKTKFYKLIDFEKYKQLHKTSSARLYEILCKNFKDRKEWACNIQSLAEKLTFEKKNGAKNYYPSDVLRYLKPSINEINKKTELNIGFHYNKDTGICIFKKLKKQPAEYVPAVKVDKKTEEKKQQSSAQQIAQCLKHFKSLPAEEQNKINEEIKRDMFASFLDEDLRIFSYMKKHNMLNM